MRNIANVSVIIPYYNSDKTIKRALESVLAQSLLPKEILIIDDKSNYNSLAYLKELVEHCRKNTSIRMHIHSMSQNMGAGDARNYGWSSSSSEFIAFLDSDDSWHPKKIEIQYKFFQKDSSLMLCGHSLTVYSDPSKALEMRKDNIELGNINSVLITKKKQLFRNRFATSTVMLRSSLSSRFEPTKRYSEDFLLWSEIIALGHKAININAPLTIYFKPLYGSSGLSSNMSKMYRGNISSYLSLYKKNFINSFQLVLYLNLSTIKYIRRLIIVNLIRNIHQNR